MSEPGEGGSGVFRLRNFRFYVSGRFLTGIAHHVQTIGVGLYVYEATRDPLALGLAGLFTFLPQLLLVAAGGHVADTFDRRLVAAVAYLVAAASSAGLFLLVSANITALVPIYAMIALVGVSRVFGMPANQAMLPSLVGSAHVSSAVAWTASVVQTATITGPAIGGFLYLLGPRTTFAVAAMFHLLAAFSMWSISARAKVVSPEKFSWRAFTTGAGFIWSHKVLLGALSLDLVAVLFAGTVALLPIYATDILNVGPAGLGWLRAGQAVGALMMALCLARFPIRRHAGRWMFIASAVFGLAIIGFGLSRLFWLSFFFVMVEGAADMVSVVIRSTLIQTDTPDTMRGRVSSVNSLFIGASNSLGEFESGLAASLLGTVPATIIGGCLALMTTALWTVLFPALRRRDRLQGDEPAQGEARTSAQ